MLCSMLELELGNATRDAKYTYIHIHLTDIHDNIRNMRDIGQSRTGMW